MFLRGKLTPCSLCCSLDRHSLGALAFVYFHIAMPVIIIVIIISRTYHSVVFFNMLHCHPSDYHHQHHQHHRYYYHIHIAIQEGESGNNVAT